MPVTALSPLPPHPLPLFGKKKSRPPQLDKSRTVAVLGGSRTPDWLKPHLEALEIASRMLSEQGYNIVTGAADGANKAGNMGALPERSYAVHVKGWSSVANERPNSQKPLYKNYATVSTGPVRSALLNEISDYLIIAPGGAGSLQELGTVAEAICYGDNPPKKVILLGTGFWWSQLQQIGKMIDQGLSSEILRNSIFTVAVDPKNPQAAADKLLEIITGRKQLDCKG